MKKTHGTRTHDGPSLATIGDGDNRRPALTPWIELSGTAWTGGMQVFGAWMRACQAMWGIALPRPPRRETAAGGNERRRSPEIPWVPQLEAKVIPLRRRTDPPGSEATRVAMRMLVPALPWSGLGADVISVEAIVGRRETPAEESPPEDRPDTPGKEP